MSGSALPARPGAHLTPFDPLPASVGPYPVLRVMARGGNAAVYAVTDPESGRPIAVKVLQAGEGGLSRFRREYRVLAALDHPNVVRVHGYGVTDTGQPYVAMELLDGDAAQVRVKAVGRPGEAPRTAEAIRIAFHVASALAYVHARGIVHRDLKSSNVVVLPDGAVKLLDFGTARLTASVEALTQPGEFVGTFHYASPEQLTGRPVDARADLYALGVLFYRLLTGRRPFEGEDPSALAAQHLDHVPEPVEVVVRGVPPPVAALVARLLEKDPDDRPADAAWVVDLLRPFTEPGSPARPDPLPSLRFVGRHRQQAAVRALLDDAVPGAALALCGAEGSARGRLIGYAVDEATRRGQRVLRVLASGTPSVFGPMGAQLAEGLERADKPEGAEAARRAVRDDPAVDADALAAALQARAEADGRRVLLAIEGMEDADPDDVAALAHTLRALAAAGADVVGVAAWGERPLPPGWSDATRVDVPPLTVTEVEVVASAAVGATAVPPEWVRALRVASGGAPATLEDLLRALPPGVFDVATVERTVPAAARDGLLLRVERVPEGAQRVLEALALADGRLGFDALAAVVDAPAAAVAEALSALIAEDLIESVGAGWAFRQGVVARFVLDRLRPTRRALLCRRIAGALPYPPPSATLPEVLVTAGRPAAAVACAVAWAQPLVLALRYAEALGPLQRVARAMPVPDFGFRALLAACGAALGNVGADGVAAQLEAEAGTPGERAVAARVAALQAEARGDLAAERQHLARATPARSAVGQAARVRLAAVCVETGELDAAWRGASAARERGDGPGAQAALAAVELEQGELGAAERGFRQALEADGALWGALEGLAASLCAQGRVSEAAQVLADAVGRARLLAPAPALAGLLLASARVDLERARDGLARERVQQAVDVLAGAVPPALEPRLAFLRAALRERSGDAAGAAALLAPAIARAEGRGATLRVAELRALAAVTGPRDAAAVEAAGAALLALGALSAAAELYAAAVERGIAGPDCLRDALIPWVERQPARLCRLALRTDDVQRLRADPAAAEDARLDAKQQLRQLVALQAEEDRASFLLHARRERLRRPTGYVARA